MTQLTNDIIDCAKNYHERGWLTLPLKPKSKQPDIASWANRTLQNVDITNDFAGGRNIGVILGKKSGGLVDIDLDCPEALAIADRYLPETGLIFGRASTPKSHWIYYVENCGGRKAYSSSSGALIEYRGDDGYTVFPPSIHEGTDEPCSFYIQGEPAKVDKVRLTEAVALIAAAAMIAQEWKQGKRHDAALALAGGLLYAKWSEKNVKHFIESVCIAANDDDLNDRLACIEDTKQKMDKGINVTGFTSLAGIIGKNAVDKIHNFLGLTSNAVALRSGNQQVILPSDGYEYTDVHNAELFALKYADSLSYNHARKQWYVYDGKRWKQDGEGKAKFLAIDAMKRLQHETLVSYQTHHANRYDVTKLLRRKAIDDMLNLSQSFMAISDDVFDADKMQLNCQNGTLNLSDGSMKAHQPTDFISRIIPVAYDENADCPIWRKFLHHIMGGNENLLAFLQRAVGYSLTGSADEQCIFIMIGNGQNGKSTFMNTIMKLLGDYAANTPMETLTVQNSSKIPNDLARLRNVRFVTSAESEHKQRLAESKIKAMTGGENITARFLHGEFFEFSPQFKIWMGTNELPTVQGTDNGIWRRLHIIPFNIKITDEEKDRDLGNKLEAELPGILNWALQGCLEWQRTGLNLPPEVKAATGDYRSDMDLIAQFLDDCCNENKAAFIKKSDLFRRYEKWGQDNGETIIAKNEFGRKLKGKGIRDDKSQGNRIWKGIELTQTSGFQEPLAASLPIGVGQMDRLDMGFTV